MPPPTSKQETRRETARPPGQRPLPLARSQRDHMNRARQAAPIVPQRRRPGRSLARTGGPLRRPSPPARACQEPDRIANRRWDHQRQPRRHARQNHRRPRVAAGAATRRPVLPHMVRPPGAPSPRASSGHRRPRSSQSSQDHAPSAPLVRPHQHPARRRQHPAIQRPSHPLDGRRPGLDPPRDVRRELRFRDKPSRQIVAEQIRSAICGLSANGR